MADVPEMVERVAREVAYEIIEAYTPEQQAAHPYPEAFNGDTLDRARSRAKRILRAIREPTDEMCEDASDPWTEGQSKWSCGAIWHAMIDAALKPPASQAG